MSDSCGCNKNWVFEEVYRQIISRLDKIEDNIVKINNTIKDNKNIDYVFGFGIIVVVIYVSWLFYVIIRHQINSIKTGKQ